MIKLLRKIKKSPIFWFFIVLLVCYLPSAINAQPETSVKAIATIIAIDKGEVEDFEVSILFITPFQTQNFQEKDKIVTSQGTNLVNAFQNISISLGKEIVFGHTDIIIISEVMATEKKVSNTLDFFTRSFDVDNRVNVIFTNGKALDLLRQGKSLNDSSGLQLKELLKFNEEFNITADSSIESYWRGEFSPSKSSLSAYIYLTDSQTEGVSSTSESSPMEDENSSEGSSTSDGSNSTASSTGQTSEKLTTILNNGSSALIKDGYFVRVLTPIEMQGIVTLDVNSNLGPLTITQGSSETTFGIRNKSVNKKAYFENGVPILEYNISFILTVEEKTVEHPSPESLEGVQHYLTQEMKDKIELKVKEDISRTLSILKEEKADVLGIYSLMYNSNKEQFKNYLMMLEDEDDFLNGIQIRALINCEERD